MYIDLSRKHSIHMTLNFWNQFWWDCPFDDPFDVMCIVYQEYFVHMCAVALKTKILLSKHYVKQEIFKCFICALNLRTILPYISKAIRCSAYRLYGLYICYFAWMIMDDYSRDWTVLYKLLFKIQILNYPEEIF